MIRLILAFILGSLVTMLTYVAYMEATYTGVLLSGAMISVAFWWVWAAGKSIKEDLDNGQNF
tara:strand:- start:57 stop:242 length:186 start_codon:yes stop_codon:yes gene_type:complete